MGKGIYRFRVAYMESDGTFTVDYPEYLMFSTKEVLDYVKNKKQDLHLTNCTKISISYELCREYLEE